MGDSSKHNVQIGVTIGTVIVLCSMLVQGGRWMERQDQRNDNQDRRIIATQAHAEKNEREIRSTADALAEVSARLERIDERTGGRP